MNKYTNEIKVGKRFKFGKNWSSYLTTVNHSRIEEAKQSLIKMLNVDCLDGKTFLDVGSGSGLFSLSARMLGATVYSFDYDHQSVESTSKLKRKYYENDDNWTIEVGSILDIEYLSKLGKFDIVYSWGVLHHTGEMWRALENIMTCVKPNGILFIALYNDQGIQSKCWYQVKKIYCSGIFGQAVIISIFFPLFFLGGFFKDILIRFKNPIKRYIDYKKSRGMSMFHDWLDWIGGFPFEVSSPDHIFDLYFKNNFTLIKLKTCGGNWGCNEFIFIKNN